MRTPPHYSTRKGPADDDEDDKYDKDEDGEDDDEAPGFCIHHHQQDPWQADEIGLSQLHFLNT